MRARSSALFVPKLTECTHTHKYRKMQYNHVSQQKKKESCGLEQSMPVTGRCSSNSAERTRCDRLPTTTVAWHTGSLDNGVRQSRQPATNARAPAHLFFCFWAKRAVANGYNKCALVRLWGIVSQFANSESSQFVTVVGYLTGVVWMVYAQHLQMKITCRMALRWLFITSLYSLVYNDISLDYCNFQTDKCVFFPTKSDVLVRSENGKRLFVDL